MSTKAGPPLKSHRLASHGVNKSVSWTLYAPEEERSLPRDPLPTAFSSAVRVSAPSTVNNPRDISTWGPSGVPDIFGDFLRRQQAPRAATFSSTAANASATAGRSTSDKNDVFYTSPSGFTLRRSGGQIPADLQAKLDATLAWN